MPPPPHALIAGVPPPGARAPRRINERNAEDAIASFLPFHSTGEFVRLVQICSVEGTRWEFLSGMKSTGATLPRSALVQLCGKNKAALLAICEAAKVTPGPQGAPARAYPHTF